MTAPAGACGDTRRLDLRQLAARGRALVFFRGLGDDDAIGSMRFLLEQLTEPIEGIAHASVSSYAGLLTALARLGSGRDPWRYWLISRLLDDENVFSLAAERSSDLPPGMLAQVRRDLRTLQAWHDLDAEAIHQAVLADVGDAVADCWQPWTAFAREECHHESPARAELRRKLSEAVDWGVLAEELARYYHEHGVGDFGRYRAFRWTGTGEDGRLAGIRYPDLIRLSDLVAYEREREPVVENTERFVAGFPANNVLLVGDRGTGKSSTVKALLNEYAPRGLRLVEVQKEQLGDLAAILGVLRERPQRFVVFIDDLSFEEHETEYKPLKALLEGTVEPRPANVVLYATSNRRHLVRERFGDRHEGDDGDVRRRDTVEEKLSLADRFGLHALFTSPDQERYLRIAVALARGRGIDLPEADLRRRAIRWADWHNGRSGRTARQFVDDLQGELGIRTVEPAD